LKAPWVHQTGTVPVTTTVCQMTPSASHDNALCISCSGRLTVKFTVPADATREYGGVEVQLHQFLTYDLNGKKQSDSGLGRSIHAVTAHSPHRIRGPVNPTAGLDLLKKTNLRPLWQYNHDSSDVQPSAVTMLTELSLPSISNL
jgi:hypothetical protein